MVVYICVQGLKMQHRTLDQVTRTIRSADVGYGWPSGKAERHVAGSRSAVAAAAGEMQCHAVPAASASLAASVDDCDCPLAVATLSAPLCACAASGAGPAPDPTLRNLPKSGGRASPVPRRSRTTNGIAPVVAYAAHKIVPGVHASMRKLLAALSLPSGFCKGREQRNSMQLSTI